jgi:hypothetical protein
VSDNVEGYSDSNTPCAESIRAVNTRIDEIERRQQKDEEDERTHNLNQLRVNKTIALFTALLFVTSALSVIYLVRQTNTIADQKSTMDQTLEAMFTQTKAMQGQLEQMKGTSKQTDKMIKSGQVSAQSAMSAAETSAKQFEASDRAWIKVDLAIGEALHFAKSGMASIGITFTITNVGHSPATNISSTLFAVPIHPPPLMEAKVPIEKQKASCAGLSSGFTGDMSRGEVLFPGQSITGQSRTGVTPEALPESCCRGFPADYPVWNQYYAVVVGCTDYQYASSARHHQTGFSFQVQMKSTPTSFGKPLMIGVDMDIDRIELIPYSLGGRYAN